MTVEPRRAHAATQSLAAALADEDVTDVEEVEFEAQLAAADDSVLAIAAKPSVAWLRVVLSVDVPDSLVRPSVPLAGEAPEDVPLSAVDVTERVTGVVVVCAHVDEPEAASDVQAVLGGDEDAMERLVERDLLWYDASELGAIPR